MALPTDRGFAVLTENADGTTTVQVCTAVENGAPVDVYAAHVNTPTVRVSADVNLLKTGSVRYTEKIVEVFSGEGGAVYVRSTPRRRGLQF